MANEYRTETEPAVLVPGPQSLATRATALAATASRLRAANASAAAASGLPNPFLANQGQGRDGDGVNGERQHLGLLRSAAGAIAALTGRAVRRPLERHPIPVAVVERKGPRTMNDLT